jgi:hypothetical protein
MRKYVTPPVVPDAVARLIDPDGGFLCLSSHWRPKPDDPDPDMPGEKLSMSSFIPALPGDDCLCGSGKRYRDCCRPPRLWRPICPNPGMAGYSLVATQKATFRDVDGRALRERLTDDARLHCVSQDPHSGFWIFWGDPAIEDQYGVVCFGDLELKDNRVLLVTAMSDLRMGILLDLLQEIAGDILGEPEVRRDEALTIDKATHRSRAAAAKPKSQRSRRRRAR